MNAMAGVKDPEKLIAAVRNGAESYECQEDPMGLYDLLKNIAAALKGEPDA